MEPVVSSLKYSVSLTGNQCYNNLIKNCKQKEIQKMKTEIILPEYILNMMNRLRAAGYEAFVAGGAVRDGLSGMIPDDFDLCTSALPSETENVFSGEKMIRTGIRHGTITVMAGKRPVEITTYRTEGNWLFIENMEKAFSISTRL